MATRAETSEVPSLPLYKGEHRLSLRMPLEEIASQGRMIQYRYPNGVVGWLVTNYDDFRATLGHPALHATHFQGEPQPSPVSVALPQMPGFIASMNGPEHLRMRRMIGSEFSVSRIEALTPTIDSIIEKYLDKMEAKGSPTDLYATYNLPIPSEVISHILGVPAEYEVEFQEAARLTIGGLPEELADTAAPGEAVEVLKRIVGELIESKRKRPADDLITRLALESDPPMEEEEIKGLCANLLLAGHETTATSSCMVIGILLSDDELRQTFLSHPDRIGPSIDELVKFQSMVRDAPFGVPRLATEDIDLNGQMIRAGEWVMPSTSFANADPSLCPFAPTELNIERDPMPHWVTFGFGPHTCIGQHLARVEVQSMVWKLFERFPNIRLETSFDEVPWLEKGFGYRMAELAVQF
jgi:cytochrome P450